MSLIKAGLMFGIFATSLMAETADDLKWKKFCDSDNNLTRKSYAIPKVNYKDDLIKQATDKLNQVKSESFYQYAEIEKIYGLCNGRAKKTNKCTPEQLPKISGLKVDTHNFLTILCGEFRDNVKLLESKLRWVAEMNIVQNGVQEYDAKKDVFDQLTGDGYNKLVSFSESLYSARENNLENAESHLELNQNSVTAMTICENRYVFSNFISKNIPFSKSKLAEYEAGYEDFKKNCNKDDLGHYYEYRGDGNFKAHSLESNAFIFVARDFANSCENTGKALASSVLTDKDCQNYYSSPFKTRYELSQNGLRRLFYYPEKIVREGKTINVDEKMTAYNQDLVFITEDVNGDHISELIILEDSLEGTKNSVSDKGATTLFETREMVTSLRQEAQYLEGKEKALAYELANSFKKAVHYIISANVIKEIQDSKKRQLIIKANKASKEFISKNIDSFKNVIAEIARNDQDTANTLSEYVSTLEKIIGADYFKGVIYVSELHEIDGKEISAKQKLNEIFSDKKQAWHRITVVLDRHTDWYKIDSINLALAQYSPTYSPWLASSYYINKSDAFTIPGYAMGLPGDGHRHWMFVQKVPVKRWFSASTLNDATDWKNYNLDILNTWFDETTFSRSSLGQHEQGWDRFGSATADEVGKIFYMYHSSELDE